MSFTDTRRAGEQASAAARTPLLAALGAGDLAAKAVVEVLNRVKERVSDRADAVRSAADDLPAELDELRSRLDPAELRRIVDEYTKAAVHLYQYLAEHGEQTLEKLKPQVDRAVAQFDDVVETAQHRVEGVAVEARDLADDVLGKVTRRTREAGEQVATGTEAAAENLAEEIVVAGGEAASATRRATTPRKPANRATTSPTRKSSPARTTGRTTR